NHYGGTSSSAQRVKIASESKTVDVKGLFGTKSYTLSSQYICSDAISSDSSVGILIKEDLNTLRTGTDKKIYIIDYKTNEYVSISVSVLKSMASMAGADFDVDEMFAGNPLEDTMIPIFTDLSNKDVSEAEYDGKTYTVVTMDNAGVTVKYYVEQRSDGNYYPVVCESYIGDAVDTTIVIHSYENDPSAYLNPPAGMKEYAVNSIVDLMNEDVMRIFTSLGA
ncbi:MAG: hypothetical protein IJL26_04145, partial [Clostridia bacterium]|nr:hypothetical protein [Clostridia bacterium]